MSIYFDGEEVGKHRLDLFVESEIIVDLKAVKDLGEIHFAVVKSQLRSAGKSTVFAELAQINPQ